MPRLRSLVVVTAAAAILLATLTEAAGAAQGLPQQPRRLAELNILRSPRFFWRAGLHGFIRSRTMTFRTNATVACQGGRGPSAVAHVFVCVLRYQSRSVRIRYTATSRYGFRLRILRPSAP